MTAESKSSGRFEAFVERYGSAWRRFCLILGGFFAAHVVVMTVIYPPWPIELWEETRPLYLYDPPPALYQTWRESPSRAFACGKEWSRFCSEQILNEKWAEARAAAKLATRLAYARSVFVRLVLLFVFLWPLWLALLPSFILRIVFPLGRWISHGPTAPAAGKPDP
jgi:hypothetical protein